MTADRKQGASKERSSIKGLFNGTCVYANLCKHMLGGNHTDNRLVKQEDVFLTRDAFGSTMERKEDIPYEENIDMVSLNKL